MSIKSGRVEVYEILADGKLEKGTVYEYEGRFYPFLSKDSVKMMNETSGVIVAHPKRYVSFGPEEAFGIITHHIMTVDVGSFSA